MRDGEVAQVDRRAVAQQGEVGQVHAGDVLAEVDGDDSDRRFARVRRDIDDVGRRGNHIASGQRPRDRVVAVVQRDRDREVSVANVSVIEAEIPRSSGGNQRRCDRCRPGRLAVAPVDRRGERVGQTGIGEIVHQRDVAVRRDRQIGDRIERRERVADADRLRRRCASDRLSTAEVVGHVERDRIHSVIGGTKRERLLVARRDHGVRTVSRGPSEYSSRGGCSDRIQCRQRRDPRCRQRQRRPFLRQLLRADVIDEVRPFACQCAAVPRCAERDRIGCLRRGEGTGDKRREL